MAEIRWSMRELKGNKVRLTGKVRLACGHDVSDGAQVRNTERDIQQGKETVRRLLTDRTKAHMRDEHQ